MARVRNSRRKNEKLRVVCITRGKVAEYLLPPTDAFTRFANTVDYLVSVDRQDWYVSVEGDSGRGPIVDSMQVIGGKPIR